MSVEKRNLKRNKKRETRRAMIKATLFMELAILMSFGMLMIGIYIANYVLALIGVCLSPIMLYSIWKYEKLMDSFKVNIYKKEAS